MPIANRCVEPVFVSNVSVPDSVDNEFHFVVNATLANLIKQLACLSVKAKDIFDELTLSISEIVERSEKLDGKIEIIGQNLMFLDVNTINPLVNEYVDVYKSVVCRDDELLNHTKMPDCIREVFNEAMKPPELHKFDDIRRDDEESMRFYTDPEFFLREWLKNTNSDAKKKRRRKKKKVKTKPTNKETLPEPVINTVEYDTIMGEGPTQFNYEDVAVYMDPHSYVTTEDHSSTAGDQGYTEKFDEPIKTEEIFIPKPPPAPLPASVSLQPSAVSALPPPPPPDVLPAQKQDLLSDIRKGICLKPVTQKREENKGQTKDLRAIIDKLRPAWEQASESSESDED